MTTTQRIRSLAVNVLCLLICLAALAFIVPAAFGMQRYVIAGKSMTGSIDRGSVVYEEVVPVSDLRVGDVITYMPPADSGIDHLVTHRIVAIHGDRFRTKGDANADIDPWTFRLQAASQPRVSFHVPYAGYPLLALQQRDTRMLLIGVPAGLVFLLALAELIGLGNRRRPAADDGDDAAVGDSVDEGAGATGPVLKVLVPAQSSAQEAGRPRSRRRFGRPQRNVRLEDSVR